MSAIGCSPFLTGSRRIATFVHKNGKDKETVTFQAHFSMNDFTGLAPALVAGAGIGDLPPVVQRIASAQCRRLGELSGCRRLDARPPAGRLAGFILGSGRHGDVCGWLFSPRTAARMGELLPSRNRQQGVSGARRLHSRAVAPVVALQAQSQATKGRELSTLAPLRALRARTSEPAWARRAVDEGVRSCPRAGCG